MKEVEWFVGDDCDDGPQALWYCCASELYYMSTRRRGAIMTRCPPKRFVHILGLYFLLVTREGCERTRAICVPMTMDSRACARAQCGGKGVVGRNGKVPRVTLGLTLRKCVRRYCARHCVFAAVVVGSTTRRTSTKQQSSLGLARACLYLFKWHIIAASLLRFMRDGRTRMSRADLE